MIHVENVNQQKSSEIRMRTTSNIQQDDNTSDDGDATMSHDGNHLLIK